MARLEHDHKITERSWNVWEAGWCVSFSGEGAEQRAKEYLAWLGAQATVPRFPAPHTAPWASRLSAGMAREDLLPKASEALSRWLTPLYMHLYEEATIGGGKRYVQELTGDWAPGELDRESLCKIVETVESHGFMVNEYCNRLVITWD